MATGTSLNDRDPVKEESFSTPFHFLYLFPQLCPAEDRLGAGQQRDLDPKWEVQQPSTSFCQWLSPVPELERGRHSWALRHSLHKPPARQLLERLLEDSNQRDRQERPSQKLLSASSPPSPQLLSLPHPTSVSFHSNPSHLLSRKPGWAERQDSLQTLPGPTTFGSLPAPPARPEAPEQPCVSQAPGLRPLHRPVAHLSPLPHSARQCIYVLDTSSETVLHVSFQELSWSCDPVLAPTDPLAPDAGSCSHRGQPPSEQLYRAITRCCIITLLHHRTVASSRCRATTLSYRHVAVPPHWCIIVLPPRHPAAALPPRGPPGRPSGHARGPRALADPALSRRPRLGADLLPLLPPCTSFSQLWPSDGRAGAGPPVGCCCTGFCRPFLDHCPVTGKAASTQEIALTWPPRPKLPVLLRTSPSFQL